MTDPQSPPAELSDVELIREVGTKVMKKNPKWCNDYCNELPRMAGEFDTRMFLWSDLRTRCLAALQAVHSQLKP